MKILKSVDAIGNERRKKNKLKRRIYKSKVTFVIDYDIISSYYNT